MIVYKVNGRVIETYELFKDYAGMKTIPDFEYEYSVKLRLVDIKFVKKNPRT